MDSSSSSNDRGDRLHSGYAEDLRRFLAADANDDAPAAEAALGALFAGLPARRPPADFAARVMARIAASPLRTLPRALPSDLPRSLRWPLAAALLLAGLASFYFLPAAWLLLTRIEPGELLAATAGVWAGLVERLAGAAWVFQAIRQLLAALLEVAGSPPVLLAVIGSAAVASLLSRWLWILLEPARRTSHAAMR